VKKITVVATIVLAILSILATSSFADEMLRWEKKVFIDANGLNAESYLLELAGASCRVNIYSNGTVEGVGEDYAWNGRTVTDLVILRMKDGKTMLKRYTGSTLNTTSSFSGFPKEGGYSVFNERCVPQIKLLPPEIRNKFKGWFGIE
jgi:hypothetical protein